MKPMLEVRYKCACMLAEAAISVPFRDGDLGDWMEVVQEALGADHRRRSPDCRATAMEYLKIPMPENAPNLGGKPELQS